MLAATLAVTAVLALWRSTVEGLTPFEVRLCLVVFGICSSLCFLQLLDSLQRLQEQRHDRRWLLRAE
ncbi:MAG: hypothetical protein ACPHER_06220 [Nevskiales bacterium]